MVAFPERLSGPLQAGYPRIEWTNLAGLYDFTLDWTPDQTLTERGNGPSLFTAIEEQLEDESDEGMEKEAAVMTEGGDEEMGNFGMVTSL